jgi:hypothetical protein
MQVVNTGDSIESKDEMFSNIKINSPSASVLQPTYNDKQLQEMVAILKKKP